MNAKGSKSILIISERRNFRHGLEAFLLLGGHTVLATRDPLDALEVVRHRHLDLIATDIALSDMDGIELIANIRDLQEDVPIVAFCDGCGEKERRALRKMEVYRCVRDPMSVEQAREEVEAALLGAEIKGTPARTGLRT